MGKSDWRNLGLALSVLQCAYAAEHRKGAHRLLNKPCLLCILRWIAD